MLTKDSTNQLQCTEQIEGGKTVGGNICHPRLRKCISVQRASCALLIGKWKILLLKVPTPEQCCIIRLSYLKHLKKWKMVKEVCPRLNELSPAARVSLDACALSRNLGPNLLNLPVLMYWVRLKGSYVVARIFFLLLLNCSDWPCLGPA